MSQRPIVVWPPNLPDPFILPCSKKLSEREIWDHITLIPYIDYVLCPICIPALTTRPNIDAQGIPGTQIQDNSGGYSGTLEQLAQELQRAKDQGDDVSWIQRLIDAETWRRGDYELARESMFPIEQKKKRLELEEQQRQEEQQKQQQHPVAQMHQYMTRQLGAQSATQNQMVYDLRARGGRNRRIYDDDDDDDDEENAPTIARKPRFG
ncbi:hypothetical protein HYFRA_00013540 [Hymenoscyphus fraxineus]|uniref:Uncharacterized protein n=1 Tax=Hymenoscyphus fraxineus TaxID=746836 RepID=A0A9N9L8X3_9HELO|nr:hypothetical protein HYFRA_00013540 [Hymenoscyphus fraxineus]